MRFATADTPPAALSEERFLEALTSVGHSQVRSIGPALAAKTLDGPAAERRDAVQAQVLETLKQILAKLEVNRPNG